MDFCSMFVSFVMIIGCVLGILGPQLKSRLMMMGGVASSFLCSCIYYAMLGEWSGFICSAVAVVGFLIQAGVPQLKKVEYAFQRAFVSVLVIVVAVSFMYQSPADLLPILGFTCARLHEASLNEQRVRSGYVIAGGLWVAYTMTIANPVLIFAYSCIWLSTIVSYVRYSNIKFSGLRLYRVKLLQARG